jgi:hypothetical protein
MTVRIKTGGRKKGTPNRRTQEVVAVLERLGCDPIGGMASIAMDERNSPELRGKLFAELAQYIAPKRRATAIDEESRRQQVIFNIGIKTPRDDGERYPNMPPLIAQDVMGDLK